MKTSISKYTLELILFASLTMSALSVGAQNVLTNPGFETDSTAPWIGFGSPTLTVESAVVHSGSYACAVTTRTDTYMGAAQSLIGLLQSGQLYNVSVWVMLDGG